VGLSDDSIGLLDVLVGNLDAFVRFSELAAGRGELGLRSLAEVGERRLNLVGQDLKRG